MKWNKLFFSGTTYILLLFVGTLGITLILAWTGADLSVSRYFSQNDWGIGKLPFFQWLYEYGAYISIALFILALFIWILSYKYKQIIKYRNVCILLVLTTVLGSGLLINGILKPYWGRPRPVQIEEFGGPWEYREFYEPGIPAKGQSFPSGHVSIMAVLIVAAAVRKENAPLALVGTIVGGCLTVAMAICRMAQGGHFLTDTIWAFSVISLTALILQKSFLTRKKKNTENRLSIPICVFVALLIGISGFMVLRKPFYETMVSTLPEMPYRYLMIESNQPIEMKTMYEKTSTPTIVVNSKGFGWVKAGVSLTADFQQMPDKEIYQLRILPKGNWRQIENEMSITLPEEMKHQVMVSVTAPASVNK